jgi:hypothetical protein
MKEHEISSPEKLDAALAENAMRKSQELWKIAEGRDFRWTELLGAFAGGASLLTGLYGVVVERDMGLMLLVVVGIFLTGSAITRRQQAQIDALRELLKRSHRRLV